MSVNLIKADLQSSGLALGESFSFISDAFFIQMGKKVRVWICWRFCWLTVGTDKWGPPSFTIWPTATLFLIKCSILKGHVLTYLDPSKLDQDGEPHIETSLHPGWGLLSPGSREDPCLTMAGRNQPALLLQPCTHPSPGHGIRLLWGEAYFQAPVLQGVLGLHSTTLTSLCTFTACLNYQRTQCGNQGGVRSLYTVYKAHKILGEGVLSSPLLLPTGVWGQSLGLHKEKE